MLDLGIDLTVRAMAVVPQIVFFGGLTTAVYYRWEGVDQSILITGHEFDEMYSDFGGWGPNLAGFLAGIFWGVFMEVLLMSFSVALFILMDSFGIQDLLWSGAAAIVIGTLVSQWQYLEVDSFVREARWYRGW